MPQTKIAIKPGYFRDLTRYSHGGGWWDGDNVRFYYGQPQVIGGWVKSPQTQFLGSCRMLHEWSNLDGDTLVALGTHLKFYLLYGGAYYDITPTRLITSPGLTNPFTTNTTSGTENSVLVAHTSHGASPNDFVTFTGASAVGGIPADDLNKEHQIAQIVDGNSYRITVTSNATSVATGGGTVVAAYQVNTGVDTGTGGGTGWGSGPWGGNYLGGGSNTGWGAQSNVTLLVNLRIGMWSCMNYGEDLVFNQRDGAIYYWDRTSGVSARPDKPLHDLTGEISAPSKATEVTVSAERHVIAFGADPFNAIGVQDKALIRFSSQESYLDWLPTTVNTAGDLRLIMGSTFVTHAHTSQEILVWSNTALHSMRYVGAPFVYGISLVSSKATIIGPKAKTVFDDTVYWMSRGAFYRYSGRVEMLNCPILDFVFNDLNYDQDQKIYAATNSLFGEVMWFIPRKGSLDNNRCIIYSPSRDIWYYTSLGRTAWLDRVSSRYPQATSGGYMYQHENGWADGSTTPESPIVSYIESAPVELAGSDKVMFASVFVPDITFRNSTSTNPQVTVTLKPQDSPGGQFLPVSTAGGGVQRITSATVEEFTDKVYVRLRGRSMALRIDCNNLGTVWQLGTPLIEGRVDGGRI